MSVIVALALGITLTEIRSHTGLRGIAALLVVAYHLQYSPNHLSIEDASSFLRRSYLMVDLFFILSGFILYYVYDNKERADFSAQGFYLRRLIRIYPLHLIILVLMILYRVGLAVLFLANDRAPPTDWSSASLMMLGAQFLLVNAWLPPPNGWNIPSWSISAEFVAYALFPLFVLLDGRFPKVFRSVAIPGILAFYILGPAGGSLDITGGVGAPARCLAGFVSGLLVYKFSMRVTLLSSHALGGMQIASLFWIILVMTTPTHDSLIIPAFILLIATTCTDQGVLARFLGTPTLRRLGEISYAVYISHILIIGMLNFGWERTARKIIPGATLERSAFIIACYAAVIGFSLFVYSHVEKPVRRYLTGALHARRASKTRATTV
ncbi:MAG TPA: acyltransferase [Sphingomicrobium sp.]|jgi:peptidoglycan/LPS O-acetylase OafA/YrhL